MWHTDQVTLRMGWGWGGGGGGTSSKTGVASNCGFTDWENPHNITLVDGAVVEVVGGKININKR